MIKTRSFLLTVEEPHYLSNARILRFDEGAWYLPAHWLIQDYFTPNLPVPNSLDMPQDL